VGGLHHVETALITLDSKLSSVRHFLREAGRKRGLSNAGGIIRRTLFGTATVMGLGELHWR
jgi:hypothetical protein